MKLIGPDLKREPECEDILRSLPEWFGIEASLLTYAKDSGKLPTFAIEVAGQLNAFITLRQHFAETWEVHCLAVRSNSRANGLGTALLRHCEQWLTSQGAQFLQVKTLAAENPDPNYAQTREFYRAKGFVPLEVFPLLWSPRLPVLQWVKVVRRE